MIKFFEEKNVFSQLMIKLNLNKQSNRKIKIAETRVCKVWLSWEAKSKLLEQH